jgi:hypothetical protein
VNSFSNPGKINIETNDSSMLSNHSTSNPTMNNSIINPCIINQYTTDDNLTLPSKEFILDNINWSIYPVISNPYIHNYEISDPTNVIDHKFLYVVIVVEIKDAKNMTEVLKQISGVVLEERKILGPNSGPTVWGTVDGICVYYAALRPYETDVIARYLH